MLPRTFNATGLLLLLNVAAFFVLLSRLWDPVSKSYFSWMRRPQQAQASCVHQDEIHVAHQQEQYLPEPSSHSGDAQYPFCDICGPQDDMCRIYGTNNLARSRAFEGSNTRLHSVLRKAERGEPVKISILGGSVTVGAYLKPVERWHAHLETWWKKTFPQSNLTLHNGAVGATGSEYWSMCFGQHIDLDSDLIFTELAVNDGRTEQVTESFEWLMRALLDLPSRPAVINLSVFGLVWAQLSTGGDYHIPVSQYYDVPHISLRNVLLPQILEDPEAKLEDYYFHTSARGADYRHIGIHGQRALTDLIVAYIQRQLCAMHSTAPHTANLNLPEPPDPQIAIRDAPIVPRLRMMERYDATTVHPPLDPFCTTTQSPQQTLDYSVNRGWEYKKYIEKNYLVSETPGSTVTVPLRVSGMGRVRLTILKSESFGLGKLACWLDYSTPDENGRNATDRMKISGYWTHKGFNLATVIVITKTAPQGNHTLTCELLDETDDPKGGKQMRIIAVDAA